MRVERGFVGAVLFVVVAGVGRPAAGQSASQLAAWDGMVLTPIGAIAPVARDPGATAPGVYDASLRYGRWRYDADDVVHDNIGVTVRRSFGYARTQLSLTFAYGLVECPTCSGWQFGGLDLRSSVWNHSFGATDQRPITAGAALQMSVGGAKYRGTDASTANSVAIGLPIEIAFPVWKASQFRAAIIPGYGYGRVASTDFVASGFLPTIGGAIAWNVASFVTVDVGVQRVIIAGGPTQLGAALSWKLWSPSPNRP